MHHWNYRFTRRMGEGEYVYELREVYYASEDETTSLSWTENPIAAGGPTLMEAWNDLAMMTQAMGLPIWDLDARVWVSPKDARKQEKELDYRRTHDR
jgi:hypothetical protein